VVWRGTRMLRALNFIAEMPYALPGVVLAIAAILLFLKPLPLLGFSLYNTVWIIFFAYLARFLVLGLRPVVSGYHQIDKALEEAAQVAGATSRSACAPSSCRSCAPRRRRARSSPSSRRSTSLRSRPSCGPRVPKP
jgi:ABC-type Fe3+ transport system permease subunit